MTASPFSRATVAPGRAAIVPARAGVEKNNPAAIKTAAGPAKSFEFLDIPFSSGDTALY
jgi:hypothetical protein